MSKQLLPKKYMEYLGLGAEIAAALLIPIGVGYFLDAYLGWSPYLTLLGAATGIILFFVRVFQIADKMNS